MQATKLGADSLTKPSDHRVLSLGKAFGSADKMGKAGLLLIVPLAVYSVVITYQNPYPMRDRLLKSLFGPDRLNANVDGLLSWALYAIIWWHGFMKFISVDKFGSTQQFVIRI